MMMGGLALVACLVPLIAIGMLVVALIWALTGKSSDLLERLLLPTYQVIKARQSAEGVRLAQDLRPALIILDVMLPNIDGWHVLLNLKSDAITADIPILICSVLETPEMAKSMGADWYLKKPPTADELQAALRALHL